MSYSVDISGEFAANPPSGQAAPAGQYSFPFEVKETYTCVNPIPLKVTSVTDEVIALGLTAVQRVYIRIQSGGLIVKVSTAAEADQIVRCGKLMILGDPGGSQPITGLKVTGTAVGEIVVCGDE